jgi:glycerate 2-kinase
MSKQIIQNRANLATSPYRETLLDIIEAGYESIDTDTVINNQVKVQGQNLTIGGHEFDLNEYEHIYVVGFGKVSCKAAYVLEQILGNSIKKGVAIGVAPTQCDLIETYGGTHPIPSVQNVELSEKIIDLSKTVTEKDLIITVVSGGGSALLCWPMDECRQAQKLYEEFLPTGGDIRELNTIRKHISMLKGGGLAAEFYPATIVGLIFSDIPGDNYELVASGPTYKDNSTIADAEAVIKKYGLSEYILRETPKEDKFFAKVTNIPLVSNINALDAMAAKAQSLGLKSKIISSELYDSPDEVVKQLSEAAEPGTVVLGAGEPRLKVTVKTGTGGRNLRLAMEMLPKLIGEDVFASIASDGRDNGEYAGAIEDLNTLSKSEEENLDFTDYKDRFDSESFFLKTGHELLETGYTDANVSDIMAYYRP